MQVLIGVDGSSGSFEATAFAGQLLSPDKDQIGFYYTPNELVRNSPAHERGELARRGVAEAIFAKAHEHLPAAFRGQVETIVGTQRPDRGLTVAAQQWRADLIVVGARGLGPIQRLLLGSVSQGVVHGAGVPVLVVRQGATRHSSALKMLLGFDPVNADVQADVLDDFTWPAEASGQAISVVETMLAGPLPDWLEKQAREAGSERLAQSWVLKHEQELESKRQQLVAYQQRLPAPFHKSPPLVVEGHAAEEILKQIDSELIDLVIIGRTVLGAMKRILMGSTSMKVLTHAPCSVLVIPPLERP